MRTYVTLRLRSSGRHRRPVAVLPGGGRLRTPLPRHRFPLALRPVGRFLPEHTTAVSLLDRLLHHAHVVVTDGDSYRMRQAIGQRRNRPEEGDRNRNLTIDNIPGQSVWR
jgi:hypothetical protein